MKQKVLVVVQEYPQVSETYIKNEVDALEKNYDLELLALAAGSYPYRSRRAHLVLSPVNQQNILEYLKGFGSAALRNRGFEWAEQFDYRPQLHVLTDLWH